MGDYGWAEFEGVYENLYDKSFIPFSIDKEADPDTGKRKLHLSGIEYDFVLSENSERKTRSAG